MLGKHANAGYPVPVSPARVTPDSTSPPERVAETALEIAAAVRAGRVTPIQVVERALDRIRERDPELRAFIAVCDDEARAEADALHRRDDLRTLPLAGVPIAVKDNLPVAGLPTTGGSKATDRVPADRDAAVVARLRAAGAIVVGKTALPEMGIWATTDGFWGETRNPHRLDRTPGGSSGGSAAAVAAGMVPLAVGNDGLGSVRIPAACCGIVGYKPERGAAPADLAGGDWHGMAVNGPLAGTVADVALATAIMAGEDVDPATWFPPAVSGSPESAGSPDSAGSPGGSESPGRSEPSGASAGLRIAASAVSPLPGGDVEPEWVAALDGAAAALERLGHRVQRADPPYGLTDPLPVFARWFAGVADSVETTVRFEDRRHLQPRTRRHAGLGRWVRRLGGPRERGADRVRRRMTAFLDDYDVLLTPALAEPPIPARRWSRRSWLANVMANARFAPFAALWNLVGAPAGVVPVGVHSDGTPLAVQVVATAARSARVLEVMALLEGMVLLEG